jgi:hypothetical protein
MKKYILAILSFLLSLPGCQDQLDVPNPNRPTPESARSETGIISLAMGGVYIDNVSDLLGHLGNWHESMGDVVGSQFGAAELFTPDKVTLDDNSVLLSMNKNGQKEFLRNTNIPGVGTAFFNEWRSMYHMNGTMNAVLENVDLITMSEAKKKTVKAWAWYWKGFAYSRIGSLYYAGIIVDRFNTINNRYVAKNEILAEAEANFYKADTTLASLTGSTEYTEVIGKLIPSICQVGKGFAPSTTEWSRNINTMRARNLLVNTPADLMTTARWDSVLLFSSNGVQATDRTFTARTDALSGILGTGGYVAAVCVGSASNGGGGNKISERLIQEFKPGDNRLSNNFNVIPAWFGPGDRGNSFNTRYLIVNRGKGMPGVMVYVNRDVGAHELYIAGTYEENVLMLAEANIRKGNIDAGLAKIDELRNYQGAGLAAVSGTGLTLDEAKEELRRERRVALAFRGFSFYDARRWGVLQNGRTGCVVVGFDGVVSTNAKIDYGFLDYWDVPVEEFFYNPPSPDSAPIVNPN